jgi:hypothetical protein
MSTAASLNLTINHAPRGRKARTMMTIRQLNTLLRNRYDEATNIRHYQRLTGGYNATMLTTSRMPNTHQAGRIFVGFTDDLRADDLRESAQ